jgi:molybdopterin-guanine dinucleotide biosynthesis protein A
MGRNKARLELAGASLAERALAAVTPRVDGVALLGCGEVPGALHDLPRLADVAGVGGPMAGVIAALRGRPAADWLVVACDQGRVGPAAVDWLLARRGPGIAAVLPRLSSHRVEPFFALYTPAALPLLERLAAAGTTSLQPLADQPGVLTPWPPPRLRPAWRDADTPAELGRLLRG